MVYFSTSLVFSLNIVTGQLRQVYGLITGNILLYYGKVKLCRRNFGLFTLPDRPGDDDKKDNDCNVGSRRA